MPLSNPTFNFFVSSLLVKLFCEPLQSSSSTFNVIFEVHPLFQLFFSSSLSLYLTSTNTFCLLFLSPFSIEYGTPKSHLKYSVQEDYISEFIWLSAMCDAVAPISLSPLCRSECPPSVLLNISARK